MIAREQMSRPKPPTWIEPMRLALRLARRGYGLTSPNPMVGAVLVNHGQVLAEGWHRSCGVRDQSEVHVN